MRRSFVLFSLFSLCSLFATTSQGLENFASISNSGNIIYPEFELGVFYVWSGASIPNEASWVIASRPTYTKPRDNISVILDWYNLHIPWGTGPGGGPTNRISTAEELNEIEEGLRTVPTENFWGALWFGSEEHRRQHFDSINDDVDTYWFNEHIVGYPIYLRSHPDASYDEYVDEMFLRIMRGACNYWHSKGLQVGITLSGGCLVPDFRDQSWNGGPEKTFGIPAYEYWKKNFDFVMFYPYTSNLEYYKEWSVQLWDVVETTIQKQRKFLITTQHWYWNGPDASDERLIFEEEAIALELKWAFDHGYIVTPYLGGGFWDYVVKGKELYAAKKPFYWEYVVGKNLLTEQTGVTYGWVEVTS